jgi:molybdate transport system regulatory protein
MHRREHRLAVRHKVWLDADGRFAVGDGGTDLVRAIARTGSVRAAALSVGWSCRHALAYLDNAERRLKRSLVERTRGGHERGGARLSADGRDFLRRYSGFRRRAQSAVLALYRAAFDRPRTPSTPSRGRA